MMEEGICSSESEAFINVHLASGQENTLFSGRTRTTQAVINTANSKPEVSVKPGDNLLNETEIWPSTALISVDDEFLSMSPARSRSAVRLPTYSTSVSRCSQESETIAVDQQRINTTRTSNSRTTCNSVDSGIFCRICHDGSQIEDLIKPCLCSGTMGLLHRSCIEKWLSTVESDHCEICGFHYNTERHPRSFCDWFLRPAHQRDRRNLVGDITCFMLLTPLATVSAWLCISGAITYAQLSSAKWETMGLLTLSVFLILIYLIWCTVALRYHVKIYGKWRHTNQVVKILSRCASTSSVTVFDNSLSPASLKSQDLTSRRPSHVFSQNKASATRKRNSHSESEVSHHRLGSLQLSDFCIADGICDGNFHTSIIPCKYDNSSAGHSNSMFDRFLSEGRTSTPRAHIVAKNNVTFTNSTTMARGSVSDTQVIASNVNPFSVMRETYL